MKQIFIIDDTQKDSITYFEREPAILVSMNRSDIVCLNVEEFARFTAI